MSTVVENIPLVDIMKTYEILVVGISHIPYKINIYTGHTVDALVTLIKEKLAKTRKKRCIKLKVIKINDEWFDVHDQSLKNKRLNKSNENIQIKIQSTEYKCPSNGKCSTILNIEHITEYHV
eukprot:220487_1